MAVEVTADLLISIVGAKEVELTTLRMRVAELEQMLRAQSVQSPPVPEPATSADTQAP